MPPYAKTTSAKDYQNKWRREGAFMPFGSICNLIGQAIAGKGITEKELISLTQTAYDQAKKFIQDGLSEEKVNESREKEGETLDII